MKENYKADLRSIDAIKDEENLWCWNESYLLETDIYFSEEIINNDTEIINYLVGIGYLTDKAHDLCEVIDNWPIIEIIDKKTLKPLLALIFEE